MFLKYVLTRLTVENVLSGVAVETGNVHTIFNNLLMFGNIFESHSKNASRLVFGTILSLESLTFHNINSAVELLESIKGV